MPLALLKIPESTEAQVHHLELSNGFRVLGMVLKAAPSVSIVLAFRAVDLTNQSKTQFRLTTSGKIGTLSGIHPSSYNSHWPLCLRPAR